MSLKSQAISPVPAETARIARAAYPKGNVYMQMRGVLGSIYTDEDFADLFPRDGQPAEAPWRLALVTVMQFVENLSDEQAANAVRGRIDWKYLLGLELTDAGFDASILSEFRVRLIAHHARSAPAGENAHNFWTKRVAKDAGKTANRFYPCAGEDPRPQPALVRVGNDARCAG